MSLQQTNNRAHIRYESPHPAPSMTIVGAVELLHVSFNPRPHSRQPCKNAARHRLCIYARFGELPSHAQSLSLDLPRSMMQTCASNGSVNVKDGAFPYLRQDASVPSAVRLAPIGFEQCSRASRRRAPSVCFVRSGLER